MCKCNIEAPSGNHCRRGKGISTAYSKCVSVALVIQHAKSTRHVILSVACLAQPHIPTLSKKRYELKKKFAERKMFVSIFSITFV